VCVCVCVCVCACACARAGADATMHVLACSRVACSADAFSNVDAFAEL
jgi:hypothetical protein